MTIPEISPLFLISMCGLSLVCVGGFAVVAFMVLQFTSGELFEFGGGIIGEFFNGAGDLGGNKGEPSSSPALERSANRNLRARADSFDFDSAVGGRAQSAPPDKYGENSSLRPDRQRRLNPDKRDLDLRPPGPMSDNPDALHAPPPPDFSSGSEYLPNTKSNIGGRVGRHNTGRGQSGQRLDSSRFRPTPEDNSPSVNSPLHGRGRGDGARDDERFGGMFDLDGDGDVDV